MLAVKKEFINAQIALDRLNECGLTFYWSFLLFALVKQLSLDFCNIHITLWKEETFYEVNEKQKTRGHIVVKDQQ